MVDYRVIRINTRAMNTYLDWAEQECGENRHRLFDSATRESDGSGWTLLRPVPTARYCNLRGFRTLPLDIEVL